MVKVSTPKVKLITSGCNRRDKKRAAGTVYFAALCKLPLSRTQVIGFGFFVPEKPFLFPYQYLIA